MLLLSGAMSATHDPDGPSGRGSTTSTPIWVPCAVSSLGSTKCPRDAASSRAVATPESRTRRRVAAVGIPVSPHCTQVSFHPARVISATLARLFQDGGHQVVATLRDAEELLATVARERPNLTVVDVRMPPTFTDEGARVARAIKEQHPGMGVLVLSQHIETAHAVNLVALGGFGYLL